MSLVWKVPYMNLEIYLIRNNVNWSFWRPIINVVLFKMNIWEFIAICSIVDSDFEKSSKTFSLFGFLIYSLRSSKILVFEECLSFFGQCEFIFFYKKYWIYYKTLFIVIIFVYSKIYIAWNYFCGIWRYSKYLEHLVYD